MLKTYAQRWGRPEDAYNFPAIRLQSQRGGLERYISVIYRYVHKTHSIFRPLGCRASAAAGAKRFTSVYIGICINYSYISAYISAAAYNNPAIRLQSKCGGLERHIPVYISAYILVYVSDAYNLKAA